MSRPIAVRPTRPRHGFWGRWWSRPVTRIRVFVSLGLVTLLLGYGLFMDLTGK
jgi:hypothetical protein